MVLNDYSNPSENILFASFAQNLDNYDGKRFDFATFDNATGVFFEEDDVAGKYVVIPAKSYLKINFSEIAVGTSDFTMDFWAYNKAPYCNVSTTTVSAELGMSIWPHAGGQIMFLGSGYSGPAHSIYINFEHNKWSHYALVRKEGVAYAFVDGVLQGTTTAAISLNSETMVVNTGYVNEPARFCNSQNSYKNLRLCNFARWTEDFEPPDPLLPVQGDFNITEKYKDQEGNELQPDVTKVVNEGVDFATTAPGIAGYKVVGYKVDDGTLISGSIVTLPSVGTDHTITFVYKQDDGSGGDEDNNVNGCRCCKPIIIYNCCHCHTRHKCNIIEKECNCCK